MKSHESFLEERPLITLTISVLLSVILFFTSIEAGQHIGDALWDDYLYILNSYKDFNV